MPKIQLTPALRQEYENLFNSCIVRPENLQAVDDIVEKIKTNKNRYLGVSKFMGIPWYFIAVIHNMESSMNFTKHLHNGDPLTARTVQVPAGRPRQGNPPFTWEESAADALTLRKLGASTDWSLSGLLFQLEGYNGWGYRIYHAHVLSPYLWGFSNHYTSGKYVKDGTWSDTAVSKQCGTAVVLRRMAEKGVIEFIDQPLPEVNEGPLVVNYSAAKPTDTTIIRQGEELQRWLNTYPGIFVKIDGWVGEKTSDAYKKVTGFFLPGDPRG